MEQIDITDTERSSDIAAENTNTSMTDVEKQFQLVGGDAVLKCFSPLLNSMKVFGLYFTQTPRRIHQASTSTYTTSDLQVPRKWNGGRIYAMVMLMLMWLNAARMLSIFHENDKFGAFFLLKLSAISAMFFGALQYTGCFIGCQTGNLDRVFENATLQKYDVVRYHRLAVIHAVVCWVLWLAESSIFLLPIFIVVNHTLSSSATPFGVHILMTDQLLLLAKVMTSLPFMLGDFARFFSCSMNYMVTSVLYDQFCALNKGFRHAIGCRGEFQGSIREFRRRHQELSQSVENADKFLMINNVAGFCCQTLNVILIAYCSIFFRNETVSQGAISATMYACWFTTTTFGLTLTACQGIAINYVVRDT